MARTKFPRRFLQCFRLAHRFRHVGNTQPQQRICITNWKKTEDLCCKCAQFDGRPDLYDDILSGKAYLGAIDNSIIGEYDSVLMLSMDGKQLY